MINRHANSPFWTSQTDKILQKLQAAGVPIEKIAAQLDVTANSVQRRLYQLRGSAPPYSSEGAALRERISDLPRKRRARQDAVLVAMRSEIKHGMWRDRAVCEAARLGAGTQAIAAALGVSRMTIYRILVLQGAPERELKARARKRRKQKAGVFRPAMAALRSAVARGLRRDQAITEAYRSGLTLAAIGTVFGLTRQRVQQIIVRHDRNA
jgi:IS30 family transposase